MSLQIQIQRHIRSAQRSFNLQIQIHSTARRIALFGASGSGKTLTLQTLAGLMTPDSGRICVDGKVFFCAETAVNLKPQERHLAYLLQDYGLFPHLTVAQNIHFGLQRGLFNPLKKWRSQAAHQWIEAFELTAILESYPDQISGGQKQRVALARALAVNPKLLLLDEPLAALDSHLRVRMRQELAQLQQALSLPSIVITHDVEDAIMLADEVYRIADGKIVGCCSPAELQQEVQLSNARLQEELSLAKTRPQFSALEPSF